MSSRPAKIILAFALLAAVCAVGANAQQPAKAPAAGAKAASGKQTAKTTQAAPAQPTAAGGLVVFIDPATGRIRRTIRGSGPAADHGACYVSRPGELRRRQTRGGLTQLHGCH